MKKTSYFLKILGCLCILVSCYLFGYSSYLKKAQNNHMRSLYKQTVKLIPDTYIPSENASLDVEGYDIKGIMTSSGVHLVIGTTEELPHYKNKNINIPDTYLKQIQQLHTNDKLTIKAISGKTLKYQLEVIGWVDHLSQSNDVVVYCISHSKYYCINLIEI